MKKKKADEIMKDFYEEYQEDPKNWSFWISPPPNSNDFYEAYILHNDEAFFLKLDSIYTPNPVGVGTKLKIEEDQLKENLPDFGFRRFEKSEVEEFLENIPHPEDYESEEEFKEELKETEDDIKQTAMKKEPGPIKPLKEPGEVAAIGPYSAENPLDYISEKQKEMRNELSKKLNKIINRDYPGYH